MNNLGKMKNPNETINIMLVMCSHRLLDVSCMMSMDTLITNVPKGFSVMKVVGLEASISKARSFWTTVFHKEYPQCQILAFIDDDMVFNVLDFWKICKTAYDEKCVVGAVYMKREFPPCAIVKVKDKQFCFNGEIQEVDGLGTGFIAIHRDVIDKVVEDAQLVYCGKTYQGKDYTIYYPVFAELVVNEGERDVWLGEDYSFCWLARNKGFRILADSSILVEHVGQYKYSPKDLMLFDKLGENNGKQES